VPTTTTVGNAVEDRAQSAAQLWKRILARSVCQEPLDCLVQQATEVLIVGGAYG